ncbi:MAG: glycoside hydrolase family 97 N-terminal domain-containing protein, partial [Leeuwenhoekiella sp.]
MFKTNTSLKFSVLILLIIVHSTSAFAQKATVQSPDGKVKVSIFLANGIPEYEVTYADEFFLERSALGLVTNRADYSKALRFEEAQPFQNDTSYTQQKIKKYEINYKYNGLLCSFSNEAGQLLNVRFQVDNNNVGYRYEIPAFGETIAVVVEKEMTTFNFPKEATSFLTPQSESMVGFRRSKPSYEEGYEVDQNISEKSQFGHGYTFPALFKIGERGWTLISETGVRGLYCGSHLSDPSQDG